VTQVTDWWESTGQSDTGTISADLDTISTDGGNQDAAAVRTDGQTLAADAQTALDNAPSAPAGLARPYAAGMRAYIRAGNDMSAGSFDSATSAFQTGKADIDQATGYIKSLTS
jgi:hypothetical protein